MCPRLLDWRTLLVALAGWTFLPVAHSQSVGADRILPLEVIVNGSKTGTWILIESAGQLYAPRDAFEEWRLRLDPNAASIKFKGQPYWPLTAVPGYRSNPNFADQSVELSFSPQAFTETRLGLKLSNQPTIDRSLPSLFFNYDMNYQRTARRGGANNENLGALTEIGFSSDLGVVTTSSLGQRLSGDALSGRRGSFLRLETTFTRHQPGERQTLLLGDTATRAGVLGPSTYFGGIRFGTNFALTPGFISQPVPILTGSSSAPSTVSLYVNDVLRQTSNIPTGPFAIENFPALTGAGEARLVVRDLLGRETVITQSFLSSSQLLSRGLLDWSTEAGLVRKNLGSASYAYGPAFARSFWRFGFSETLTINGITEVAAKQQRIELGLTSAVLGRWLGNAAIAGSRDASLGVGSRWLIGFERQGLRSGVYLQAQGASSNFRDLGQSVDSKPIKRQLAGNWTYSDERWGSFGIGFASITPFDAARIDTFSANYSTRLGDLGSLNLAASRSTGAFRGSSFGLSWLLPLQENGRVISGSANRSGRETDFYVAASQSPTQQNELGWRILTGEQQSRAHAEGGLNYSGRYGNLGADVSARSDQTTTRLTGSSGLVFAGGMLFATRRATGSYAIAEVAGYRDVGIGLGNNVLSRTDANGIALIPNLVPYQRNSIRLDAQDLPISAEVDSIEQTSVPAWRSVVKVTFPVRGGRGALLKLRFDDSDVAPAGAVVRIAGDSQEFYVARRGEAFVTGLQSRNRVILSWQGRECSFDVILPAEKPDEIARIGPLLCKGVTR